jgi:hypothetical protein
MSNNEKQVKFGVCVGDHRVNVDQEALVWAMFAAASFCASGVFSTKGAAQYADGLFEEFRKRMGREGE